MHIILILRKLKNEIFIIKYMVIIGNLGNTVEQEKGK